MNDWKLILSELQDERQISFFCHDFQKITTTIVFLPKNLKYLFFSVKYCKKRMWLYEELNKLKLMKYLDKTKLYREFSEFLLII